VSYGKRTASFQDNRPIFWENACFSPALSAEIELELDQNRVFQRYPIAGANAENVVLANHHAVNDR
jgi:hypothetical protein